ncbi:DUF1269 domain-containing protein [Curtobacterium flaccumfaciens]|uniref:DUF1269 domain-containing protein n=1 Tax=Curtobacterium flaccumfaciens TaxID=2035 RepID=UPI001BDE6325|nr:DUF1269 domain-containing protein [Curtobacterium flaccumfaciens]MBT1671697.1 DUF1269 domain-containing protein [Curtobacterium flaccumfaciens pv. flaccumfaciens]
MSHLIVLVFDDADRGRDAYEAAQALDDRGAASIDGVALVRVDAGGTTHVDSTRRDGRLGVRAGSSAVFGAVLGFLFLVPVVGLVVGGAVGALFASLDSAGLDASLRQRLSDELVNGGAALLVYTSTGNGDAVVDELASFSGTVLRTPLSEQAERAIAHDLQQPD